ncbi:MAG: alkyl hydroperoxide reductase/Thiol specific antioxidant/Mal allergen [Bacteroidetes bacterium]|nr:alkyl hydroperoxide reductase/Thiol specific antioxidant/Mal allergen [Bacteroidota bacterium]
MHSNNHIEYFMKTKFVFIILLSPVFLFAQEVNYTIRGKIGLLNAPSKVYLRYNDEWQDSTVFQNGNFKLKGQVSNPIQALLFLDYNGVGSKHLNLSNAEYIEVYLENAEIVIKGKDSLNNAIVEGGVLNKDYQSYLKLIAPTLTARKLLNSEYSKVSNEKRNTKEFQEEFSTKFQVIMDETSKVQAQYIKSYPNSLVSLDLLKDLGRSTSDISSLELLFNGFSTTVRNSVDGKAYASEIENRKRLVVGGIAPDFSQPDTQKRVVKLSDFKGQYVLIDFWASWCKPCRNENPNVAKAYNQYKNKGFTVLGVSLDSEKQREAWLKAIVDDQLPWTQVSDLRGWKNEVAQLYMIRSIPQNFLIDPAGKIIAKNLRGQELNRTLEEIFK